MPPSIPGNPVGRWSTRTADVIGMNTAVASDTSGNAPTQNIGFAITVDSVKPLLAKLRPAAPVGPDRPFPS